MLNLPRIQWVMEKGFRIVWARPQSVAAKLLGQAAISSPQANGSGGFVVIFPARHEGGAEAEKPKYGESV